MLCFWIWCEAVFLLFSVYFVSYFNFSASQPYALPFTVNLNQASLLFLKQNTPLSLIFPLLASVWETAVHGYFGASWSPYKQFRRERPVLTPCFLLLLLLYWESVHEQISLKHLNVSSVYLYTHHVVFSPSYFHSLIQLFQVRLLMVGLVNFEML